MRVFAILTIAAILGGLCKPAAGPAREKRVRASTEGGHRGGRAGSPRSDRGPTASSYLRAGNHGVDEFDDVEGTLLAFAHQGDDLLWMFPFFGFSSRFLLLAYPAPPVLEEIVRATPAEYPYAEKWLPIFGRIDITRTF